MALANHAVSRSRRPRGCRDDKRSLQATYLPRAGPPEPEETEEGENPAGDVRPEFLKDAALDVPTFQQNRARFSWEDLKAYDGQWVGFSADGRRIVASATDLPELDARIRSAGEDPEEVWLERIAFDDASLLGGAELSL